ncbi:MAG: DUF2520 domain-containing protein [Acidobacteriia bacterium]|nr:DUF2520 domain-containing protein [Terriglobia bacterium]
MKSTNSILKPSFNRIVVIGAGRVGQTLARLLSESGYTIEAVVCRSLSAARAARRFTRARRGATRLEETFLSRSGIIWITTPDDAIASTALALAQLPMKWAGRVVIHSSGALSSLVLKPLRQRGASVGSLHPIQTFTSPRQAIKRSHGIFYTFEGDAAAQAVARRLVQSLDGRLTRIKSKFKPLYHCAGSFACGGLMAPLSIAYEIYEKIGIRRDAARSMLQPLIESTLEMSRPSTLKKSLTGPISRGDELTIRQHLLALEQMTPQFVAYYANMSLRLLTLAGSHLSVQKRKSIRRLLAGYARKHHRV